MITPYQLNLLTDPVNELYEALEIEIIKQVARRLKVTGEADITEYQLKKLNQLHLLNRDVEDLLSSMSGVASEEIRRNIHESGYRMTKDTDEYMKLAGMEVKPPPNLDSLMESYVNQTFREINNFVNQTLVTTVYGEGTVARDYQKMIEATTAKYSTGLLTLDQAVEQSVKEWAQAGVKSTFVDKGGHTWSLERYTKTVLKSTNSRIYNELRTSRMAEYGVHTVLMSSKSKARPECSRCQGKVLDMRPISQSGYPSIYEFGYGRPDGTRGINCGHDLYPYVPGISVNNQPQYPQHEAIKNERIEQQRKEIARRIVKTKKMLMVTTELKSDGQDYYTKLLRKQQAQMRLFIEKNKSEATFNLRRVYKYEKVYTPLETLVKEFKERADE